MLKSIHRLTKHSLIYGIGYIFSRSIGFLLLPIHTHALLPREMGVAALLFATLGILNILFGYGTDVAFLRFYVLEKTNEGKRRIFSNAFLMILSTGFLFTLGIFLFRKPVSLAIFQSESYESLIPLAAGILLADALALIPFLVLRGEEKSIQFGLLKLVNVVANFSLNLFFVMHLNWGVKGIFTANLLASTVTLLTVIPVILPLLRFRFHRAVIHDLLKFGLPYVPSMMSVLILDQISRFFLDRMLGKEATGVFSACYKLGMFMSLVVAAFRFAWHPFFLSTLKQKDARSVFARVFTYFVAVTGFLFLVISFYLNEIIHFRIGSVTILGEAYYSGLIIVPVVMLGYIFYGCYVNFIVGIYVEKKTLYLPLITGLGALISVLGNAILIPRWGIMGSAVSIMSSYFMMAMTLYWVNQRLYPIPYEWRRVFQLLVTFAALYFIGTSPVIVTKFIYRLGILAAIGPILYLMRFFTPEEKQFFNRHFFRRRHDTAL